MVSEQSGTLQRITFNPTSITANTGSACNTTTANPCRIEIIATSHIADFPVKKTTGGYPAGASMSGTFTGTPQTGTGNGDTISLTASASGLREAASTNPTTITDSHAINSDVINATPGAGSGDTVVSLPSSCTGLATCKFMSTALVKAFNTSIVETVQQQCDSGQTQCYTRLRTKINVNIKKAGNKVSLPTDNVFASTEGGTSATEALLQGLGSPLENLDVNNLLVFNNSFETNGRLTLNPTAGDGIIDPTTEEVQLNIDGKYTLTILPESNCFNGSLQNRLFTCVGNVDGVNVAATIARGADPSVWTFIVVVGGANLSGAGVSQGTPVFVEFGVGKDYGRDNSVTARIF